MAKKKQELKIDEIINKGNSDFSDILKSFEIQMDNNYQMFLKALLAEIEINGLISNISEEKLTESQKNDILKLKNKYANDFLAGIELALKSLTDTVN